MNVLVAYKGIMRKIMSFDEKNKIDSCMFRGA